MEGKTQAEGKARKIPESQRATLGGEKTNS